MMRLVVCTGLVVHTMIMRLVVHAVIKLVVHTTMIGLVVYAAMRPVVHSAIMTLVVHHQRQRPSHAYG